MFEENFTEIENLIYLVRVQISTIDKNITQLQSMQSSASYLSFNVEKNNGEQSKAAQESFDFEGKSSEEHLNNVIMYLKNTLANYSEAFKESLEERSQSIKKQRDRKSIYASEDKATDYYDDRHTEAFMRKQQSLTAKRQRPPSYSNSSQYEQEISIEIPHDISSLKYQQQLLPPSTTISTSTEFLRRRGNAIQGIESTINEIGAIFQHLSQMIHTQGESVQRYSGYAISSAFIYILGSMRMWMISG